MSNVILRKIDNAISYCKIHLGQWFLTSSLKEVTGWKMSCLCILYIYSRKFLTLYFCYLLNAEAVPITFDWFIIVYGF